MEIKQLTETDERWLRRWMMQYDPIFAMHRQLKDYFLQNNPSFGSIKISEHFEKAIAVAFWSRHHDKSFIHCFMGDLIALEPARVWLNTPCQLYLHEGQELTELGNWEVELKVTAGYVIDHPAYEGVFARVAPRFNGTVYEHP